VFDGTQLTALNSSLGPVARCLRRSGPRSDSRFHLLVQNLDELCTDSGFAAPPFPVARICKFVSRCLAVTYLAHHHRALRWRENCSPLAGFEERLDEGCVRDGRAVGKVGGDRHQGRGPHEGRGVSEVSSAWQGAWRYGADAAEADKPSWESALTACSPCLRPSGPGALRQTRRGRTIRGCYFRLYSRRRAASAISSPHPGRTRALTTS